MAPPKRKAPPNDRSNTPPNQIATTSQMQLPQTSVPQTPLTPAAQAVFDRVTAPEVSAAYACTPNLSQRVEFQTGSGCDILVRKHGHSEFILKGIFMIARNDFFLTPDGSYNASNSFGKLFPDVKLNCRLACPSSSTFPFAITDFQRCIDNLRSIERVIKLDKNGELVSSIGESLSRTQFKISHALFEPRPNTSEETEGAQSGTDTDTAASGTQVGDEYPDLGAEFAMQTWPVAPRNVPYLEELCETHDVCPLPAFDAHDNLIPPSQYEESLKGATVEVYFTLGHHFIKSSSRHVYTAILRRMQVLERPSALPSSPFKRVRVSAAQRA